MMDRVCQIVGPDHPDDRIRLEYWLSRPPGERLAEVERLRRIYIEALGAKERHGLPEGLSGPMRIVDRE